MRSLNLLALFLYTTTPPHNLIASTLSPSLPPRFALYTVRRNVLLFFFISTINIHTSVSLGSSLSTVSDSSRRYDDICHAACCCCCLRFMPRVSNIEYHKCYMKYQLWYSTSDIDHPRSFVIFSCSRLINFHYFIFQFLSYEKVFLNFGWNESCYLGFLYNIIITFPFKYTKLIGTTVRQVVNKK